VRFGRAALWVVPFVLCFLLICTVVVPVPFVCCSVKLPLSRPTSFCLFLSILLHTPARGGAAAWRFCCRAQPNHNTGTHYHMCIVITHAAWGLHGVLDGLRWFLVVAEETSLSVLSMNSVFPPMVMSLLTVIDGLAGLVNARRQTCLDSGIKS